MRPRDEQVRRLTDRLRLMTPLIALYESEPSDAFAPLVEATDMTCCFAYYDRWLAGETLVIRKGGAGCKGAQPAVGFQHGYPPFMPHFMTDGVGAPQGEGLKATPAIAQQFLDAGKPPAVTSDAVLIGPLRVEQFDKVRSVTFLVNADRLSAVMTLASYWTAEQIVTAPFGSGCALLWRAIGETGRDVAVIGATDVAMRRHVPADVLMFTVTPSRFEQMLTVPDGSFLDLPCWNELMEVRAHQR